MTGWAATTTPPGKPPYRIAGIPPGIISADDYDVTDEALAYLARAALVEAALTAAERVADGFSVVQSTDEAKALDALAARLRAVREGA